MKEIATKIYEYGELNKEAKEKANQWFLDNFHETDMFADDCKEVLKAEYKMENVDISFDFGYSQGDYFEINGKLYLEDLITLPLIKENFSEKEIKRIKFIEQESSSSIEIENNTCTYSEYSSMYSDYDLGECCDIPSWASGKKELKRTSNKLIKLVQEKIINHEIEILTKCGYDFFYEVDEEEVSETCYANGYMFYEDGEFCC